MKHEQRLILSACRQATFEDFKDLANRFYHWTKNTLGSFEHLVAYNAAGEILASLEPHGPAQIKLNIRPDDMVDKARFGTPLERAARKRDLAKLLAQENLPINVPIKIYMDDLKTKMEEIFKQLGFYPYP